MIVPTDTSKVNYGNIFAFESVSAVDGSRAKDKKQLQKEAKLKAKRAKRAAEKRAAVNKGKGKRELAAAKDEWELDEGEKESDSMGFDWHLVSHEPRLLQIKFDFENPEKLSTTAYGDDKIACKVKNFGMFVSAETGERLDRSSLDGGGDGDAQLTISVPPQILDEGTAESLTATTDSMGSGVSSLTTGNFVVSLLMKGSMQQLWGMIRAMQLMILPSLLNL
jgi:hypothetical protein